jgi:hypothetical protein
MTVKPFLNNDDLAARWGCKKSTIRNARPENLPARFVRPGSRLVLYPLMEVIAFEKAHFEPRDYVAERDLGLSRGPADVNRLKGCRS